MTTPEAPVERVTVYTDGASRGNPGPAAIGVVVDDGAGRRLTAFGRRIGRATNNVAEYRALLAGIEEARRLGARWLRLCLDSELAVRQLTGRYRVRHPDLLPLYERAMRLLGELDGVEIVHVPRERNREADALANRALDART
ncbi:MAG: ribonuclease HI family protein [Chloroflexi bacterium]|nr:ribonuclease HI family protein [Chloroflexota bacterium]